MIAGGPSPGMVAMARAYLSGDRDALYGFADAAEECGYRVTTAEARRILRDAGLYDDTRRRPGYRLMAMHPRRYYGPDVPVALVESAMRRVISAADH